MGRNWGLFQLWSLNLNSDLWTFYITEVITTKFLTWHDSSAVVACAKICRELMPMNEVQHKYPIQLDYWVKKKIISDMDHQSRPCPILPGQQGFQTGLRKTVATIMQSLKQNVHHIVWPSLGAVNATTFSSVSHYYSALNHTYLSIKCTWNLGQVPL